MIIEDKQYERVLGYLEVLAKDLQWLYNCGRDVEASINLSLDLIEEEKVRLRVYQILYK